MGRTKQVADHPPAPATSAKPIKPSQSKTALRAVLKTAAKAGNPTSAATLAKARRMLDTVERRLKVVKAIVRPARILLSLTSSQAKAQQKNDPTAKKSKKRPLQGKHLDVSNRLKERKITAAAAFNAYVSLQREAGLLLPKHTLQNLRLQSEQGRCKPNLITFVGDCINQVLDEALRVSLALAGSAKRRSITLSDVTYAARKLGLTFYLPLKKKSDVKELRFTRKRLTPRKAPKAAAVKA
jgi:histone H3/H4